MLFSALQLTDSHLSGSLLEKRDPRSKIIMTFLLVIAILSLSIEKPLQMATMFLLITILILLSWKSLKNILKPLAGMIPMMLLISIVLPFRSFLPSEQPVTGIGGLGVYESGLLRFTELNIKFVFLVSGMMVFVSTTSIQKLLQSLQSFRLPDWLTSVLYFMVYFVFLLKEELMRQYLAYKSRYIYLSFWQKVRIIGRMLSVFFIRLIERNETTTMAMVSRGFYGRIHSRRRLNWKTGDSILIGITFLVLSVTKVWL